MAKHAFAAYLVSVNRRYKTADRQTLGNLHGKDLLQLLHGLLKDVEKAHLRTKKQQRILTVSNIATAGRTITFSTRYGIYGLNGQIIDVDTATVTHEYGENESPVSPTRNMLVIPKDGRQGLYLAERYGGGGAYSMVKTTIVDAVKDRFDDEFTIHIESHFDPASWQAYLERAQMTALSVTRYHLSSDRADEIMARSVGKVSTEFRPPRGTRFPTLVKQKLVRRESTPAELVGMDFGDDYEAVVSLDDSVQKKKLVLGRTDDIAIVYEVASDDADRPSDRQMYSAMRNQVDQFSGGLDRPLPADWRTGSWPAAAKGVVMRARRG